MNARPPAWIGPRGCAALGALGLAAGALATLVPWQAVAIAAAVVALAAFAADAVAIARAPEFTRSVPQRLSLARASAFAYTVTNRSPVALRFAIYEAPAERRARGSASPCCRANAAAQQPESRSPGSNRRWA